MDPIILTEIKLRKKKMNKRARPVYFHGKPQLHFHRPFFPARLH
jgi:hypothetical protein